MNEIAKPVAQWIGQNVGWTVLIVIFVFSLFFEFSKIKLSPITSFLNWIGTRLTGGIKDYIVKTQADMNTKIEELRKDTNQKFEDLDNRTFSALEKLRNSHIQNSNETQRKLIEIELNQDTLAAARIKAHVLNFSRSLRIGEKHTEEDFKNLIKENELYEELVKKHGWKNDVYKADYDFLYSEYQRCQHDNGFLK